jgi:hypothetical protein
VAVFWVYRFGLSVRNLIIDGRRWHAHWSIGICNIALSIKHRGPSIIDCHRPAWSASISWYVAREAHSHKHVHVQVLYQGF